MIVHNDLYHEDNRDDGNDYDHKRKYDKKQLRGQLKGCRYTLTTPNCSDPNLVYGSCNPESADDATCKVDKKADLKHLSNVSSPSVLPVSSVQ